MPLLCGERFLGEGRVVGLLKQALEQLALTYPDRINPHLT